MIDYNTLTIFIGWKRIITELLRNKDKQNLQTQKTTACSANGGFLRH